MNIYPEWTGTIHQSVYPAWLGSIGAAIKKFSKYACGIIYYRLK